MNDKRTRVEFIESYWKDGNTDYIWNDNHGELIRCKDCVSHGLCRYEQYLGLKGYCSKAERKGGGEDG